MPRPIGDPFDVLIEFYVPTTLDYGYLELHSTKQHWWIYAYGDGTWELGGRAAAEVYTFVPDVTTWYSARFQGGAGWLRGKVWKRSDSEPEAWGLNGAGGVQFDDSSPGLMYADGFGADPFQVDQIIVTEFAPQLSEQADIANDWEWSRPFDVGGVGSFTLSRPFDVEYVGVDMALHRRFDVTGALEFSLSRPFEVTGLRLFKLSRPFAVTKKTSEIPPAVYVPLVEAPVATTLASPSSAGDTTITVTSATNISRGMVLDIDGEFRAVEFGCGVGRHVARRALGSSRRRRYGGLRVRLRRVDRRVRQGRGSARSAAVRDVH